MREAAHQPEAGQAGQGLSKDREQLRAVQQSIIFDKAVDFLVSKATVTTAAAPKGLSEPKSVSYYVPLSSKTPAAASGRWTSIPAC
jgi:hypothetical protein